MTEPNPVERLSVCRACGRTGAAEAPVCPHCGAEDWTQSGVEGFDLAFLPDPPAPRGQFRVSDLMLTVFLLSLILASARFAVVLGVLVALILAPTFYRYRFIVRRWERLGLPPGLGKQAFVFTESLGVVLLWMTMTILILGMAGLLLHTLILMVLFLWSGSIRF